MAPVGIITGHTASRGWLWPEDPQMDGLGSDFFSGQQEHHKYSIGIVFVGGILEEKNPSEESGEYSQAQYKAFDSIMKTYYNVWPGNQAWGRNDLGFDDVRPNFSVPDMVKTKYKKINILASDDAALGKAELKAAMIEQE